MVGADAIRFPTLQFHGGGDIEVSDEVNNQDLR